MAHAADPHSNPDTAAANGSCGKNKHDFVSPLETAVSLNLTGRLPYPDLANLFRLCAALWGSTLTLEVIHDEDTRNTMLVVCYH